MITDFVEGKEVDGLRVWKRKGGWRISERHQTFQLPPTLFA
jgi:hypothetical protein